VKWTYYFAYRKWSNHHVRFTHNIRYIPVNCILWWTIIICFIRLNSYSSSGVRMRFFKVRSKWSLCSCFGSSILPLFYYYCSGTLVLFLNDAFIFYVRFTSHTFLMDSDLIRFSKISCEWNWRWRTDMVRKVDLITLRTELEWSSWRMNVMVMLIASLSECCAKLCNAIKTL
jgi:hypothetical protein